MINRDFDYDVCRNLILKGILDSIEQKKSDILAFPKHPIGTSAIQGISLDIFPWHSLIQISFCHDSDIFTEESIAEWRYYDFVSSNQGNYSQSLDDAANYIYSFWEEDEDEEYSIELRLKAHTIFHTGAEAILDKKVSDLLIDFGLDQFTYSEHPLDAGKRFIVCDEDQTLRANHCEIIKANRATELFIEELKEAKSIE